MKKILLLIYSFIGCISMIHAQNDSLYVMKNGQVIGVHSLADIDSMVFQSPISGPVSVWSISLSANQLTLSVGESRNLMDYLSILPANASNKSVSWESSLPSVVAVNAATGVAVAGTAAGVATLTVRTLDGSNRSATMQVSVVVDRPNPYYAGTIPHAVYIGRWEKFTHTDGKTYDRSYYTGAMLKVNFTGKTALLNVQTYGSNAGLFVSIDGGAFVYFSAEGLANGKLNLTPTPLAEGEHSLRIVSGKPNTYSSQNNITATTLELEPGAETRPPTKKNKHIEFIGDSISTVTYAVTNPNHWNFLIGEELNVEHSHVAQPSISLSGMANDYFKTYVSVSTPWDFSRYTPDVVVVNLGQNGGISASNVATYRDFLLAIRAKFPDAHILALGLFSSNSSSSNPNIQTAVTQTGDAKIHYSGAAIGATGTGDVHPNLVQSRAIADLLKPVIAPYLGQ